MQTANCELRDILARLFGVPFLLFEGVNSVDTRIAVIGIIVEDKTSVDGVNTLLHQYGGYIIGRMGLPYEKKNVNIISIVIDAPQDAINALSGKLGRLP